MWAWLKNLGWAAAPIRDPEFADNPAETVYFCVQQKEEPQFKVDEIVTEDAVMMVE